MPNARGEDRSRGAICENAGGMLPVGQCGRRAQGKKDNAYYIYHEYGGSGPGGVWGYTNWMFGIREGEACEGGRSRWRVGEH